MLFIYVIFAVLDATRHARTKNMLRSPNDTALGGQEITFNELMKQMKEAYNALNDAGKIRSVFDPSPCSNGVLPTRFLFQGGVEDIIWLVPSYKIEDYRIMFDAEGKRVNYDKFLSDVTSALAAYRAEPSQSPAGGTRRRRRTRR
jgi:hypothetical protein